MIKVEAASAAGFRKLRDAGLGSMGETHWATLIGGAGVP
jgi:hypothetical protein